MTIAVRRTDGAAAYIVVARLKGTGSVELGDARTSRSLKTVLTTEDPEFATDPQPPAVAGRTIRFQRPSAIILKEE